MPLRLVSAAFVIVLAIANAQIDDFTSMTLRLR
jgi:hypothetical protein